MLEINHDRPDRTNQISLSQCFAPARSFGMKHWQPLVGAFVLCFYLIVNFAQPAIASTHTYPEGAAQVMYRSQQSLRDTRDRAWQAVLYKRVKSDRVDSLHLRLVGFPGVTEVSRSEPLRIAAGTGQAWTARDVLLPSSFPGNVGEYDFLEVMAQLTDAPLRLSLPLKGAPPAEIIVPPFVAREWRQVFSGRL